MAGADGHNMTTIDTSGGGDGSQDTTNAEDTNAQPQPRNAANPNAGGEGDEAAGGSGQDEGEANGEGEGAAAEGDVDEAVEGEFVEGSEAPPAALTPDAVQQMIAKGLEDAMKKNAPAEAPPQLTDEQWAAKEQEVGADRKAIQFFTNQSMKVYNAIRDHIDERFAKIEKTDTLRSISREKGFEDAMRYPKGVEAYLSKFAPKFHSNPELLKQAVIYARGLSASRNVQRARVESEKNRRIAGTARPSSPGGSGTAPRKAAPAALTQTQREVARKFNMSDSEYSKLKNGSKVVAA